MSHRKIDNKKLAVSVIFCHDLSMKLEGKKGNREAVKCLQYSIFDSFEYLKEILASYYLTSTVKFCEDFANFANWQIFSDFHIFR